ncbi:hydrogen peroxide-inducible genes activator [Gilvimarinus sp. DA14]|uniref:hydrogen peroxide-inducible genes activator n=1 Tax=Gilvimarinus sp. DA14 TaxID=2956798 RepID=UPI0020B8F601|nr:hydrogen peroxide-inducible genes activator [Gilvimarinus sp. DA14]UTF58801.1 LysR substrate-binding domain-containing protein [Gilvimarinus sp. DA14]
MTLTELRYIVTLAQEQHFGRAAERCFVSQPTLSIAVKKLEEELGVALFERSKSRVSATPLGEKIVAQANLVLEQTSAIKDIANEGKDQLSSPLAVGAIFTIGPYLLPYFIPELQKEASAMPLYVEEGYTGTLRTKLRKGELDVIIVALPFTEADVVTQPLYEEPFVVLLRKDHPLAEQDAIDPRALDDEEVLLLGEGHCFRDQVLETCPNLQPSLEGSKGKVRTAAEGSSLETLRHMVASGLGITILPVSAASTAGYSEDVLVTRPFSGKGPQRTVALAWRASFPRFKAVDALRNAIRRCQRDNPLIKLIN